MDFRAYTLEKRDADFKKTLNAAGRQFKNAGQGELPEIIKLQSVDTKDFYYPEVIKKQKIVLHNTAGIITGSAFQLTQNNVHVSTPFLVARDGTIYQLFDDRAWSYHLGTNASMPNSYWSPRSIGIEIDNLGPLREMPGNPDVLIDIYNKPFCRKSDTQYYKAVDYRGYKYYASFTEAQYVSVNKLVAHLCKKHGILFSKLPAGKENDYSASVPTATIVPHTVCRKDKYDVGPAWDWNRLTGQL